MRASLVLTSEEMSARARPVRPLLPEIVFYGTFGLLLLAPLLFGAADPWAEFVLEAGAIVLFALWVIWQRSLEEMRILGSPLFLPMLCFAGLIVVQLIARRTSYAVPTRSEFLLYCAYGILAFLLVQSLRRNSQIHFLAWLISAYGLAVASFAVLQSFGSHGQIYWLFTPVHGGWIYGPYVNHNHYAGLMEMLLPFPLVISLLPRVSTRWRAVAGGTAALMASTIFLSGSRGGMFSFLIEMAVLAPFVARDRKSRKLAAAAAAFIALMAVLLVWLGGTQLSERIASIHAETQTELSGGIRLNIDRDGLRIFRQKPVLGWGLGTFPTIYPKYRSFYTNVFVNAAHDDYVQLLVEMGGLGFAIMLWFIVAVYYHAAQKLKDWTQSTNGVVALAAMVGVTGILIHSFVDFNLQIPANAALFYAICAIAAMDSRFTSSSSGRRRHRRFPDAFENRVSA